MVEDYEAGLKAPDLNDYGDEWPLGGEHSDDDDLDDHDDRKDRSA